MRKDLVLCALMPFTPFGAYPDIHRLADCQVHFKVPLVRCYVLPSIPHNFPVTRS